MIAYGPVPSRRLGKSTGINNIPFKSCSYSCVYCQLGKTTKKLASRQEFYPVEQIFNDTKKLVEKVRSLGEKIDYLTFVADGEPTLDINIGKEIQMLKPLECKVAVISNSSLISEPTVRDDLMDADWVSLKLDSANEKTWRKINIPAKGLELPAILQGIKDFSRAYKGVLATETMLVEGINDEKAELEAVARKISLIHPDTSYISIPTRPPAFKGIKPPDEQKVVQAYHVFKEHLPNTDVELLVGFEGDAFVTTGDAASDLLSITSVHPMRERSVKELLKKANSDWSIVKALLEENALMQINHEGINYYLKNFKKK